MTAWLSTGLSFYILVLPITLFAEEPYIKARPNKDIDNACMFPRCGVTLNHPWPSVRLLECCPAEYRAIALTRIVHLAAYILHR